jgi:hypothetical protein
MCVIRKIHAFSGVKSSMLPGSPAAIVIPAA